MKSVFCQTMITKANEAIEVAQASLAKGKLEHARDAAYTATLRGIYALCYAANNEPLEEAKDPVWVAKTFPAVASVLPSWYGRRNSQPLGFGARHVGGLNGINAEEMIRQAKEFVAICKENVLHE